MAVHTAQPRAVTVRDLVNALRRAFSSWVWKSAGPSNVAGRRTELSNGASERSCRTEHEAPKTRSRHGAGTKHGPRRAERTESGVDDPSRARDADEGRAADAQHAGAAAAGCAPLGDGAFAPAVLLRTASLTDSAFHPQVHLALISVQLIFGVGAVIGKLGVESFNPILFVGIRDGVGGPLLVLTAVALYCLRGGAAPV
eukprot:COSAG04_NODE_3333_length_2920_cov_1.732719_1_plen_198_part_10